MAVTEALDQDSSSIVLLGRINILSIGKADLDRFRLRSGISGILVSHNIDTDLVRLGTLRGTTFQVPAYRCH